ncbi:MAG TPA: tetratricopeptide repeat protein [Candidatus Sulfotelmatobacter sp.]|nr:tetratricopeptide repeat protein [Candidatus Sulfotelmatobacter sp.]
MAITATRIAKTSSEKPATTKHEQGLEAFKEGRVNEAIRLFAEAVAEGESSEIWNDWAAAQLAVRNTGDAERAFRRALKLQPDNHQAAANLGVLLATQGRAEEAIPLLEQCQAGLTENERATVTRLLEQCRTVPAKSAASGVSRPLGPISRMMLVLSAQTSAINMMSLRLIAMEEIVDKLARGISNGGNGKK